MKLKSKILVTIKQDGPIVLNSRYFKIESRQGNSVTAKCLMCLPAINKVGNRQYNIKFCYSYEKSTQKFSYRMQGIQRKVCTGFERKSKKKR